jgi:hypothetical protein
MEASMAVIATLRNTDLADLFVTVNDLNLAGSPAILDNARINESQSIQIAVQESGSGTGNVKWIAQRVDGGSDPAERTVEVSAADEIDVTTFFG